MRFLWRLKFYAAQGLLLFNYGSHYRRPWPHPPMYSSNSFSSCDILPKPWHQSTNYQPSPICPSGLPSDCIEACRTFSFFLYFFASFFGFCRSVRWSEELSFRANHRYIYLETEKLIIVCAWCHGNYGRSYGTVTFILKYT